MKQFSRILMFLVVAVLLQAANSFAYSISFTDDYWTLTDATTGTDGDATFMLTFEDASYDSDFGLYILNDDGSTTEFKIYDADDEPSNTGTLTSQNVYLKYSSGTWYISLTNSTNLADWTVFGNVFGFYYYVEDTGYTWYTDVALNEDGAEHIGTLIDQDDNVYIYLDDQYVSGTASSDRDFNDMTVYGVDLKPVPEPATMLLFGAGLIGLAAIGRKRFVK